MLDVFEVVLFGSAKKSVGGWVPARPVWLLSMDIREAVSARSTGSRHPWELARVDIVDLLLHEYAPDVLNGSGAVLDMGCGDAFLAQSLAKRYPAARVVGVDTAFDDELIQTFRDQQPCVNVELFRSFDSWTCGDNEVSAVLLMDVLEHVRDDQPFIRSLAEDRRVRDDALFIVSVPAYEALFASHDEVLGHYRRYTRRRLTDTVTQAGLDVAESGYLFASLVIPRLVEKMVEKIVPASRQKNIGRAEWPAGAASARMCRSFLTADFRLVRYLSSHGINLPGLSCYAVCRISS